MRILNCHVENFGKLHDVDIDFTEGLNLFYQENGWGKSTLAAFIRVMFYGFAGDRKRDIAENERKKYLPWQGGTYGGKLCFETKGKRYTVSRVFQDKELNDLFELRDADTNLESQDFSANLGEELFQINRESFLRSAFIGQSDCVTKTTDGINAKMGNLADNTGDLDSYEAANNRILGLLNAMSPSRKTGDLYRKKAYLTDLGTKVREGEGLEDGFLGIEALREKARTELLELTKQIEEIQKLQSKVSRMQDYAAKKERYLQLKEEAEEKVLQLQALKEKFPGEVPKETEVRALQEKTDLLMQAKKALSIYALSEEEKGELAKLVGKFNERELSAKQLEEMAAKSRRFSELSQKIAENRMPREEMEQLIALEARFGEEKQPRQKISRLINRWNDCNMRKKTLEMLRINYETQPLRGRGEKMVGVIFGLIGIVALFAGIWGYLTTQLPVSAEAVMGGGGVLFLLGIVLFLIGKRKNREDYLIKKLPLEQQIEEDEATIEEIRTEVFSFLSRMQITCEEVDVPYQLQHLSEEASSYEWLAERKARAKEDVFSKERDALKAELSSFLDSNGRICEDEHFAEQIGIIKEEWNQLQTLKKRFEESDFEQKEADRISRELDETFRKYGMERQEDLSAQLMDLVRDVTDYRHAESASQTAKEHLQLFEKENDVNTWMDEEAESLPNLEELNRTYREYHDRRSKLQEQLMDYEQQLDDYREQIDERRALIEELQKAEEEYGLKQEQYARFKKVQMYLGKAKEAMTAKYMAPLKAGFERYYTMVTGKDADKYHFDANANVTVEEGGIQRETEYFSKGYQDLIGLCLRLAFVDAMYPEEAPTLFLDDPFVNLDDKNTAGAKKLLDAVAKKYQVLYFTCSEDRS